MKFTKIILLFLSVVFRNYSLFRELLDLITLCRSCSVFHRSFLLETAEFFEVLAGSISADRTVTRIHKVRQVRRNRIGSVCINIENDLSRT